MKMKYDNIIGIDISKEKIDVCILCENAPDNFDHHVFENSVQGFKALFRIAQKQGSFRAIFEATGRYHQGLELFFSREKIPFTKVNPAHAKYFGKAIGKLAKTDKIDALMLAKMGMLLTPKLSNPLDETIVFLKELLCAYRYVTKVLSSHCAQSKTIKNRLLKKQHCARTKLLEQQKAEIFSELVKIAKQDEALKQRMKILCSIPGIGEITAIILCVDMPELGTLDNKQIAALAGLAPITRQSGKWKGQSVTGGGRHLIRYALYMPAHSAARNNPILKEKYQELKAKGKAAKCALTAIMRKLLCIANTLLCKNQTFQLIHS